MPANETVLWGCSLDYSQRGGGATYVTGGTIAGSALATFQANIGKNVSIMHLGGHPWMSNGVANPFSTFTTNLNILTAAGILPCIDWLPFDSPGHSNDLALRASQIAAGAHDAYITAYAQAIKAWGKDVCIRTFVESNIAGQYPWQYGPTGTWTIDVNHKPTSGWVSGTWTNTVADVVNAYIKIGTIFKQIVGCFNAKLVLNLNIVASTASITVAQQVDGALPYIDILSMDGYTEGWAGGAGYRGDFAKVYRGGGGTSLQDTYGLIAARHPTMPLMISECGWAGTKNGATGVVRPTIALSALARSGATWTLTLASTPDAEAVPTSAFDILGVTPAAYNGEWNIVSGSGTSWVVTGNADNGAPTVTGATVQVIDRVGRAAAVTKSLETDLPAMPRIKYILLFWVNYNADTWVMDYNGTQPNNVDMLALRDAIGNAHYLRGQTLGTDVSTVSFIPYQDQNLSTAGAIERYRAICRSSRGMVGGWLLNDVVGTTTIPDESGNSRTGTVNGSVTMGAVNVLPSEPTWTAASFPGSTGSNITIADNNAFSVFTAPATTGTLTVEASFLVPSAPPGTGAIVSKGAGSNFEWSMFVTATTVGFTLFQLNGTTYSSNTFTMPTVNAPHHLMACINTVNTSAPFTLYLDGVPQSGGAASGVIANGTAAVMIGQRADTTQPFMSGGRIGPVFIYSTCLSAESAADHYAVWQAGPVITNLTAA